MCPDIPGVFSMTDEWAEINAFPILAYDYEERYVFAATAADTLDRGLVGFYRGAKVKMSNNIFNDDVDDYVMLKTGKAIAYLNGIDKLEAYQPERRFSDAVKGLNTYGGKIIRQNEIAVLVCHKA